MKISLKVARINAGLKQKDVAEKVGISRDYLHKIESGKVAPKVDLAFSLVGLYNININDVDFLFR